MLKTIQLMRGFAAIAVVEFHVDIILKLEKYGANNVFSEFGAMGWLGVNFFFVLSGFIILNAHHRDIGIPHKVKRYVYQRVTRLYPIYWILLLAFIVASELFPTGKSWSFGDLLVSFTLLPLSEYPSLPLQVAWTLLFEVKFYLVFSLLIISRRLGAVFISLWILCLIINNFLDPIVEWTGSGIFDLLNIWNINFVIGMAIFWIIRVAPKRLGWPLLMAGLVVLWTLVKNPLTISGGLLSFPFMIACAFSFGMIIAGAVLIEESTVDFKAIAPFQLLGDSSYSIYLVHSAAISAVAIVANKLKSNDGVAIAILAFAISIILGIIIHVFIERPLLKFLRGRQIGSMAVGNTGGV